MFDMNQCKPGDKLVTKCGYILTYVRKKQGPAPYPHFLNNGRFIVARTDNGTASWHGSSEDDIIGFAD